MPIETICKGCSRKLRVADEHAGSKARCPHCRTVYLVPASTEDPAGVSPAVKPSPWQSDLWLLRTEEGTEYGPVAQVEMELWVREGRVTAGSQMRREGEREWVPATRYYPSLAAAKPAGQNPFGDSPRRADTRNAPRPETSTRPTGRLRPHRGGTILALGIFGLVCCQIAAPIAWALGHTDLSAIRAGRMDPGGRSMTQAGMVLGIVGTLLLLLSLPALRFAID